MTIGLDHTEYAKKRVLVPIRLSISSHAALHDKCFNAGISMQKALEILAENYICDKIELSHLVMVSNGKNLQKVRIGRRKKG